jgi:hypothetical protein
MLNKSIFPPEVKDFEFHLSSDILLTPSSPQDPPFESLLGEITLNLNDSLHEISKVEFRFVGGIVTTFKDKEVNLYGHKKLFDQTVTLDQTSELKKGSHQYEFMLNIPSGLPSSVETTRLRIQYLMVCVISFSSGCLGIPYFAKDPIRIKQEVKVGNVGLHPTYTERARINEEKCKMTLVDADKNGSPMLVFTPNENVLIRMTPTQIIDTDWEVYILLNRGLSISQVEFLIEEHTVYKYSVDDMKEAPVDLKMKDDFLVAEGVVYGQELFDNLLEDERQFKLTVPANQMLPDIQVQISN